MLGNGHVRFGKRGRRNRITKVMYGAPAPTSRDASPSPEDVHVTRQIVEAGKLLDVQVLDHLVIGAGSYVSLKERGLGFQE